MRKSNIYCGYKVPPKGKVLGTQEECAKRGRITRYGVLKVKDSKARNELNEKAVKSIKRLTKSTTPKVILRKPKPLKPPKLLPGLTMSDVKEFRMSNYVPRFNKGEKDKKVIYEDYFLYYFEEYGRMRIYHNKYKKIYDKLKNSKPEFIKKRNIDKLVEYGKRSMNDLYPYMKKAEEAFKNVK